MTLQQDITTDSTQIRLVAQAIREVGGNVDAAMGQAIKRTVVGSRTVVVRETAKDLGIAQKRLYSRERRGLPIRQRMESQGKHVVGGQVSVEGRRVPLAEFKPSPVWKKTSRKRGRRVIRGRRHAGARYRIGGRFGGSERVTSNELFVAEFASGKRRVYARVGKGRKLTGEGVQERYGPSVPHVAENRPKVRRLIEGGAAERLAKEANAQADRVIARGASRG